ncbi:Hypothetical predicted protein [Marmota monax]|uniref:Uncharacterized protein n=1 Tax=Marmota monax TaxID=9995 RepID=A0A5E4BIH3_MARMO|nr:hypothetical protein GHT09_001390 [Marmota monax]VTJ69377.1 Hypothetical predicted protein [Marmota monax]
MSPGVQKRPRTKKFKIPVIRAVSRRLSRRGSTISLSRTSGASSPQSSMISMNPGSDEHPSVATQVTGSKDVEDNESSSTKPDEEPLHINLQKLLEMVREDARRTVMMENEMQRKAPSRVPRDIVLCKSGLCSSMRARFYSVAQEAGFCLQDKMEIFMKHQEERGLQKFNSFGRASTFQKDMSKMRHQISLVKGDAQEIADHWYFDLLSKLPEDLKSFRPAKKILAKLQKFGENLDLRIRPHVLLKVLQELRIWELCSPDVAVAIENQFHSVKVQGDPPETRKGGADCYLRCEAFERKRGYLEMSGGRSEEEGWAGRGGKDVPEEALYPFEQDVITSERIQIGRAL